MSVNNNTKMGYINNGFHGNDKKDRNKG
jgi:hypothetical protein